jgi:hypothetical protein
MTETEKLAAQIINAAQTAASMVKNRKKRETLRMIVRSQTTESDRDAIRTILMVTPNKDG